MNNTTTKAMGNTINRGILFFSHVLVVESTGEVLLLELLELELELAEVLPPVLLELLELELLETAVLELLEAPVLELEGPK